MSLRALFYLVITIVNIPVALFRPFYGLLVYSFIAYSRPDILVWGDFASKFRISFIAGLVLVLGTLFNDEQFYAKNKRVLLIIVFWILCYVSLVFSGLFWSGSFEQFTKILIVILITTGLVNTPKRFYMFCLTITGFLALYASRQGIMGGLIGEAKELSGHLSDNNFYACWICAMYSFVFYMAKNERKKWLKIAFYIALPLILLALMTTYSRGGYIGIAAVFIYITLRAKRRILAFVIAIILGITIFTVMPRGVKDEALSIKSAAQVEASAKGRLHFWRVALNIAKRKPLTGVGLGRFEQQYNNYDFSAGEYGEMRSVHSTFFEVLAENGIPAFIVFIILVMSVFISGIRIRGNLEEDSDEEAKKIINWTYMIEGAMVGFLFSGIFISAAYLDIWWYILALSIALEEIVKNRIENRIAAQ